MIDEIYFALQDVYAILASKFFVVLVVLLLGLIFIGIIAHIAAVLVKETPFEQFLKKHLKLKRYPSEIVESIVYNFGILALGIFILFILDIATYVFWTLVCIVVLLVTIFILLNLKELGPNTYAYYRIMSFYPLEKGKIIIQSMQLEFVSINALETTFLTDGGDTVVVSNTAVFNSLNENCKQESNSKTNKKSK